MNDQLEVLRLLFAIGGVSFLVLMLYVFIAAIIGMEVERWWHLRNRERMK